MQYNSVVNAQRQKPSAWTAQYFASWFWSFHKKANISLSNNNLIKVMIIVFVIPWFAKSWKRECNRLQCSALKRWFEHPSLASCWARAKQPCPHCCCWDRLLIRSRVPAKNTYTCWNYFNKVLQYARRFLVIVTHIIDRNNATRPEKLQAQFVVLVVTSFVGVDVCKIIRACFTGIQKAFWKIIYWS